MHEWCRRGTGFATRHQVVHRGSAADAGGVCRTVAPLRFHGPSGGPQDAPGGGDGAHVAPHLVGDCRAGDRDVAAGGVVGVLGHHRGDRQQRGRGDRHPRLSAQLSERRRVRPPRQSIEPPGATGPHRRRRRARAGALHPLTTTLIGVRAHHVWTAGGGARESTAQRRGSRTTGAKRTGTELVTICALNARHFWNVRRACATVRTVHQDRSLRGMGADPEPSCELGSKPQTRASLTRGLRHISG